MGPFTTWVCPKYENLKSKQKLFGKQISHPDHENQKCEVGSFLTIKRFAKHEVTYLKTGKFSFKNKIFYQIFQENFGRTQNMMRLEEKERKKGVMVLPCDVGGVNE